jgi:hypothetical protein
LLSRVTSMGTVCRLRLLFSLLACFWYSLVKVPLEDCSPTAHGKPFRFPRPVDRIPLPTTTARHVCRAANFLRPHVSPWPILFATPPFWSTISRPSSASISSVWVVYSDSAPLSRLFPGWEW